MIESRCWGIVLVGTMFIIQTRLRIRGKKNVNVTYTVLYCTLLQKSFSFIINQIRQRADVRRRRFVTVKNLIRSTVAVITNITVIIIILLFIALISYYV